MRRLVVAAGLAFGLVTRAGAQTAAAYLSDTAATATVDALLVDHDFSAGVGELVRVFLQAKQVYRAELSTADVTIVLRSPFGKKQLPRVYPLIDAETPSGSSIVEIYPDVDGDYELRPATLDGHGVVTRLRLYHDGRASRRRTAVLDRPGWEVGIELAAGWHSGYGDLSRGYPLSAEGDAGTTVEGCFAARQAPGLPPLSMCVLGLGWESQPGRTSTLWFFTEPRVRILGKAHAGRSNWEAGGLFRFGLGSISRSIQVPVVLGPGLYAAREIRTSPKGSGWSLLLSYTHAMFRNLSRPLVDPAPARPSSDRVTFGLGWYQ